MTPRPEAKLSDAIKAELRARGVLVWSTEAFRQRGPSGVTAGLPDLVTSKPEVDHLDHVARSTTPPQVIACGLTPTL